MGAFAGKTILVTGASSGIGRALCLGLASQRPRLVLAARDEKKLEEVAAAARAAGAETLVVVTDVSSAADCRRLVEKAIERFAAIDVLIANAGITMWSRLDQVTDLSVFERILRVNVLGAVYPTYYALPHLRHSRGRIVAISSLAGLTGVPERSGYAASKHALFGFFDSLRIELEGTGVSVTIAAPDFVASEIHRRAIGPDGRPLGSSPMQEGRIMTAEECARGIIQAMGRRRRLWIGSTRGKVGRFARLILPGTIDRVAARAIRRRR